MTRSETRNRASSDMAVVEIFKTRLHEAQEAKGLTNEALARELDVSLRLVQKWRQDGRAMPSPGNLARLAKVLDRPMGWFFGENGVEAA